MGRIHQLDHATANGIAAGEVVERPASVVKELVENAIDAGATVITVEIAGGGISLIRVTDDGCGMDEEDAKMAFLLHATSKLDNLNDLYSLHTMGFRGEALASIAAASRVTMRTCQPGMDTGTEVVFEAGHLMRVSPAGGPAGTRIEVRDLFFNLPARYKFLKKDATEAQYITVLCERFALIRPDISFRLINQGKEILHSPGNNDALSSLYCIYGRQIVDRCIPVDESFGELQISGFVGKPDIAKANRSEQTVFVNDRLIRSKAITSAIDEAYKTMLMKGRYAFLILSIRIPSALVDVNVHPQKAEVRFWNDSEVFRAVFHIVNNALLSSALMTQPQAETLFSPRGAAETIEKAADAAKAVYEAKMSKPVRYEEKSIPVPPVPLPQAAPRVEIPLRTEPKIDETAIPASAEQSASAPVGAQKPAAAYPVQNRMEIVSEERPNFVREEKGTVLSEPGPYGFSINDLMRGRIIGTAFATYILLELDNQIILLDQHAAHEKILFEKLCAEHETQRNGGVRSQPLLVPDILSMTPSDMLFLQEIRSLLEQAGFRFEPMGDREIILREIPDIAQKFQPSSAFRNTIDSLKREVPRTDEALLMILATSACKAAVKGHDRLDEIEIRALLRDLSTLKNPYHCPHGRPIMIRLSRKDLEKEFKRIV